VASSDSGLEKTGFFTDCKSTLENAGEGGHKCHCDPLARCDEVQVDSQVPPVILGCCGVRRSESVETSLRSPGKERTGGKPKEERKPIARFSGFRLDYALISPGVVPEHSPSSSSSSILLFLAMVAARSSNERPRTAITTNTQPQRNSMYWSPYQNATDDEPPVVPPKDPDPNPMFLSPVSTSFPPAAHPRPRYTSFSVYEPQYASMTFPEPHPHRSASHRSVLGTIPPIRHKASRSDVGFGASSESLWRPNSNRGSYAATVCYSSCFLWTPDDPLRPAGTASLG